MKALILAAGYGTRLGELTREIPKPMLPVGDKPLLAHTLAYLKRYGFDEVAINLHFKPEMIREHFGDGSNYGTKIIYSHEETLLGTAGAVGKLREFFSNDDFLVIYGDLFMDQDLSLLVNKHRAHTADATLLLHQRANSNSLVQMNDDGRITGFVERPTEEQRAAAPYPWVNSGCQVLSPRVLELIPDGRSSDLPRDIYTPHVGKIKLYGVPLTGNRIAIDSPERYEVALSCLQ